MQYLRWAIKDHKISTLFSKVLSPRSLNHPSKIFDLEPWGHNAGKATHYVLHQRYQLSRSFSHACEEWSHFWPSTSTHRLAWAPQSGLCSHVTWKNQPYSNIWFTKWRHIMRWLSCTSSLEVICLAAINDKNTLESPVYIDVLYRSFNSSYSWFSWVLQKYTATIFLP
jgi:hypothetical protein